MLKMRDSPSLPREVRGRHEVLLRLERLLADGVYGGQLLQDGLTGVPVAVKTGPDVVREAETLRRLGAHPHVVPFDHLLSSDKEQLLVTGLCPKGSLADHAPLEGPLNKRLVHELLRVVIFLHQTKKVIHGGLSDPGHFLLTEDRSLNLCGFSQAFESLNLNQERVDLDGMALSLSKVAVGGTLIEPEVALQNPRYLVSTLSRSSKLTRSESLQLACFIWPLLKGQARACDLENHIYLMSPENVLRFIDGCKDFLMSRANYSANSRFETARGSVVGHNWKSQGYLDTMREGRRYDNSITDLLRLIRNKNEHYSSMPSYVKGCLKHPLVDPGNFLDYFTGMFPGLIAWTWHCMHPFRHEANLQSFYPEHAPYIDSVPVEQMLQALAN